MYSCNISASICHIEALMQEPEPARELQTMPAGKERYIG
jgi:hypothetical protein